MNIEYKENQMRKQKIILIFISVIIVLLSFFIDVVFIGLLGIILIIPSSIILGIKGALVATATATIAVIISSYISIQELNITNIIVSLLVYWFIGIAIGKSVDTIKEQKKQLKEKNTELIDSKNEMEKVFQGTQDNMFLIKVIDNKTYKYVRNNKAHQNSTGISLEEIKNKTSTQLLGKEIGEKVDNDYRKCIKLKESITYEEELILPSGKKIWNTSLTPLIKEGKVTYIIGSSQDITEKKKSEEKDRFIQTAMKNAFDSVIITDPNFKITYANKRSEFLFGYDVEELMGESVEILYDFQDIDKLKNIVFPRLKEGKEYEGELRTIKKNGKSFICELKVTPLIDENNNIYSYVGTQKDITDKKEAEEKIYNQKEQFKTTLMSVGDAVISTNKKGEIKLMNNVAENLTGWTQEEAYNQPLEKVLKIINEHTREIAENPASKALRLGKVVEMENHTILISKEGKEIQIEDSASPIKDRHGYVRGAVIVFRDFSEKRKKQKEIEYLSFHDHHTGLYNRRYMEDSIKRLDTDRNIPFSIISADINGLKLTNDAYGHEMGDKLIVTVAEMLKKSCREEDILCRIGGDEFVILLPNVSKKKVDEIIERIKEEEKNAKLDPLIVSLALGYSTKDKEEKNIFEVYKEADGKMYKDKLKNGRIMKNRTIETVLKKVNRRYDNEKKHSDLVSQYCRATAKAMKLSNKEIQDAKKAGALHDIGKIIMEPKILNKKSKLTEQEWEEVKKHSSTSYQLLKSVDKYTQIAEADLYHHERIDGNGYPEGLKEDEIPLLSRIISVADAYEAMTSERPYKTKKAKEEAVEELKKYSGSQFDKKTVDIFVNEVL